MVSNAGLSSADKSTPPVGGLALVLVSVVVVRGVVVVEVVVAGRGRVAGVLKSPTIEEGLLSFRMVLLLVFRVVEGVDSVELPVAEGAIKSLIFILLIFAGNFMSITCRALLIEMHVSSACDRNLLHLNSTICY